MSNPVKAIPDGQEAAIPYMCCKDAIRAIEFYKKAFNAEEVVRMVQPDGRLGHAELKIGKAHFMLCDEFPEMGMQSPQTLGGTPVMIHLYVEDVDAFAKQAEAAGAKITRPVENQFYGDRAGKLEDPFGHGWWVSSHVEEVSVEELDRRFKQLYAK